MAFIDQVQDLTSLTVSDNDELSQFLKDGVLDVTSRWLAIKPQDVELFGRETSEQTSNGSLNLNGARIISVIREDGVTSNNWRACRKISPSQQYLVTDEESLSFASKFNPAYMVADAGKISVFPAPGSDPNAFKAYYVNKDPVNSSGSALIHSHDDILYFPIDKVYLVVMYAGMRLLHASMGATTITDLSVTAVPPDAPSAPSFTVSTITEGTVSAGSVASVTVGTSTTVATVVIAAPTVHSNTVPSYTDLSISTADSVARVAFNDYWTLADFGDGDPGTTVVTAVPPDVPILGTGLPTYEVSSTSVGSGTIDDEIAKMLSYIETDEDVELANAKAGEITLRLKRALEKFNSDVAEYKTENEGELARYSTEINAYTADVNAQVQEYTQKLQRYSAELNTVYQAWAKTESDNLQLFQIEIQNELNNFNEANAVYQAALKEEAQNLQVAAGRVQQQAQIEIQEVMKQADVDMADAQKEADLNLQASIQNTANALKADIESNAKTLEKDIQEYANTLGKYGAEIQAYQAEVGTQIQEYTQNLQADGIGYQWLQDQYAKLKAEYDQAFMIAAPKQQQQVRA
jgi:hypothetical protein